MKIGILTFHRAYNSGAMLQAWALKRTLEKMGHVAEFPACNHVGDDKRWVAHPNPARRGLMWAGSVLASFLKNAMSVPVEDIARARFLRFRKDCLPERECGPEDFGKFYDALVVGSDQVWNAWHAGADLPLFLGENWPAGTKALAYAASYGEMPPTPEHLERIRSALGRFAGVSVREEFAQKQLEGAADGKCVAVAADPTLLLEKEDYLPLAEGVCPPKEPYLLVYNVFYPVKAIVPMVRGLASRLGVRAILVQAYQYTLYGAPREAVFGVSPDRLLAYTAGARYVLAGSLHGTILGLLFGKPTLSLGNVDDGGRSRQGELMGALGLASRRVAPTTPPEQMERLLRGEPFPPESMARLGAMKRRSLTWLRGQLEALGSGRQNPCPVDAP